MRRWWVLAIFAIACGGDPDGDETDAGAEVDAGAQDDAGAPPLDAGEPDAGAIVDAGPECAGAADGTACGDAMICLDEACVRSECGDGFADEPEEACDDGNDVDADGCTACMRDCTADDDCDDGDACNGNESCDLGTFTCAAGTPVACDDTNACTADACATDGSCTHDLIDGDADGFASTSLGACGTDCDDTSDAVHPGAAELCDAVDQDCDGSPIPPTAPAWYLDCDGDDYAASGAPMQVGCAEPAPHVCGGGWTTRAPSGGAIDCDDTSATVRPGATEVRGDGVDQDCDGREICFTDADSDGYYIDAPRTSTDTDCADVGEGSLAEMPGDCDDGNIGVRPNAAEIAGDEFDQNCDGRELCYRDRDDDGYALLSTVTSSDLDCDDAGEATMTDMSGDCDDSDADIHRGALELCNAVDEDCNGAPTNTCPDDAVLGTTTSTRSAGGSGGRAASATCPSGLMISGFAVRSGTLVDNVRPICRDYTFVERASTPEYRYRLESVPASERYASSGIGGGGGSLGEARCTDASVVTGISGRNGSLIDHFSFRCTEIEAVRASSTSSMFTPMNGGTATVGSFGGTGGSAFVLDCPAGYVAVGVQGTVSGSNIVESLRLTCARLTVLPQ